VGESIEYAVSLLQALGARRRHLDATDRSLARRGIKPSILHAPFQLTDIAPTVLDATCVTYPTRYPGREPLPLEGRSMLPALRGGTAEPRTLYWEHLGNAAIRRGRWKLVREHPLAWELYDIDVDGAELHDQAAERPDVVAELTEAWAAWANRVGVIPWSASWRSTGGTARAIPRGDPARAALGKARRGLTRSEPSVTRGRTFDPVSRRESLA